MSDQEFNEKDIGVVIRYLEIHNPENADRDYAIQLLESMQGLAHDISKSEEINSDLIQKALNNLKHDI